MSGGQRPGAPRWLFWGGATLTGAVLAAWLVWVSPFLYPTPAAQPIDKTVEHRVFAYGTLTNILVRSTVARGWLWSEPATLEGYRREGLDIVPDPDSQVDGEVFTVTPRQLRRLDRYERLDVRYHRELKILTDGDPAWVYQLLGVPTDATLNETTEQPR